MNSLMVGHRDLIAAGCNNDEDLAKFIVQGMLVLECPAHVGASRPRAKTKR